MVSARVMEEAPVIILVYNPDGFLKYKTEDQDYYWWSVDTQSIWWVNSDNATCGYSIQQNKSK